MQREYVRAFIGYEEKERPRRVPFGEFGRNDTIVQLFLWIAGLARQRRATKTNVVVSEKVSEAQCV